VIFPNPGNILRPGQFGKVRFVADQKKGAMVVPARGGERIGRAISKSQWSIKQQVSNSSGEMGERIGAMWEVTEGLKPGDKVCRAGNAKSARRIDSHGERVDAARATSRVGRLARAKESLTAMSEFFVRRPIVAIGHCYSDDAHRRVCILALPIAQYPQIGAAGDSSADALHGADALTIEQSVAAPIEQQMSGVDNMNYMYSINANSGDID